MKAMNIISELNSYANKGSQERSVVLNIILFYILIIYSIISFFIYPFPATAILLLFCLLITWRLSVAGYDPLFLFKLLLSQESLSHILSTDQIKQATKRRLKQMVSGRSHMENPDGSHIKKSLLKNSDGLHTENSLLKNSGNRSTLRGPIEKAVETTHKTDNPLMIQEDVFSDKAFTRDIDCLKNQKRKELFAFELDQDIAHRKPSEVDQIEEKIRIYDTYQIMIQTMDLAKVGERVEGVEGIRRDQHERAQTHSNCAGACSNQSRPAGHINRPEGENK